VNRQLGNKAYRLDHPLQTHFSRAARAAEQPPLARDGADRIERGVISLADAWQDFGIEKCGLDMPVGKWQQNDAVRTASA
jgi:hypothetical protein